MIVSFPHALEDFHYGDLARLGIALPFAIALLIVAYAMQLLGIALTARNTRAAPLLLGSMGAIWCVGAVLVHGHDVLFAGADYRHGLISKLMEVLIIVLGAAIAIVALGFVRAPRSMTASTRIGTRR
ncbi:MAG: hypothetical protein JOY86_00660 [Candidatus Eremiobacteraeota bacterium]|nr:hypothetical protein [Candidatus Eremiobacteraeota bacterium]